MMTTHRTRLAIVTLAAVALVACGGGGGDGATTSTDGASTTTAEVTDATAATTSTSTPGSTTSVDAVTTTTAPAEPVMPLTGLPITDPALASRPALVVKIDNHPQARPQYGLNAADLVYEENVEKLTRFAAVFQSQDSDPVGPIRSGRTQDVILLGSLNKPLFAWSGGNANVTKAIRDSDLVELSPSSTGSTGGFFRNNRAGEDREHTLYSKTSTLYTLTPVYAPPPPQQFTYRQPGEAFNGEATKGVDLKMDGVAVTWTWDPATTSYLRFQGGKPHNDATLGQVNAANVVVLEVDYQPSPADARSPEAQTVGTGKAHVFTGGVMIDGTWSRNDRLQTFQLKDSTGAVIALTPGRTWIELARVDSVTPKT
ncbi:MAG: hypothetical protein JWN99_2834 [Ilumatobacteraceae bacterium]|nr:hypothetical protein [Ilumatobacteraceae bacterium]